MRIPDLDRIENLLGIGCAHQISADDIQDMLDYVQYCNTKIHKLKEEVLNLEYIVEGLESHLEEV